MANTAAYAADTLLEKGVKVYIRAPFLLRLCGRNKVFITVNQPSLGNKIRIDRLYYRAGLSSVDIEKLTFDATSELLIKHYHTLLRMVAIALFKGRTLPWLLNRPVAWWLAYKLKPKDVVTLINILLFTSGTVDFKYTIASFRQMLVTTSQETQGS